MNEFTEDMLKLFSSSTRCRIIELLGEGWDHPEDLAKKLDMTRQAVDKHLLELHDWGLVERNAIFPSDGRPKIIYERTKQCKQLINTLEKVSKRYKETMISRAQMEMDQLDMKLAEGQISEEVYDKKIAEIKKRWNYNRLINEKD